MIDVSEYTPHERAFRIAILMKKRDGHTKEQFMQYWIETHAPLFRSLDICKTNLIKYEQCHTNVFALNQIVESKLGSLCDQDAQSEWDGMAIFEGESFAKLFEILMHDEFKNVIVADALTFTAAFRVIPFDVLNIVDI